jgi:hypothetical protein
VTVHVGPRAGPDLPAIAGGSTAVLHLAVQGPRQVPYPQPSCSGAMPDGVGGQFVNGQDHLNDPVFRHSRLTRALLHGCPQRAQRAGIKR